MIRAVYMSLRNSGSGGTTVIDVNKGAGSATPTTQYSVTPTTIYTTQANRPMLAAAANANATILAQQPNTTAFNAGDVFTMDIDQIATGAQDLTVRMLVAYTGEVP